MCLACSDHVRFHHQSFPDVLAGHVAGDFAENVPAQVQGSRVQAQSQGRVQGRAVRARRRVLVRDDAAAATTAATGRRLPASQRSAAEAATVLPADDAAGRGRSVVPAAAAVVIVVVVRDVVFGEKEPRPQATANSATQQVQIHGPVGHIGSDRSVCGVAEQLSPRVQVHGKAGRSKTGSYTIHITSPPAMSSFLSYMWCAARVQSD